MDVAQLAYPFRVTHFIIAIQQCKEHEIDEGVADTIERGWLIKEGANDDSRRKRLVDKLWI